MFKLFSLQEANSMIPVAGELLGGMQSAIADTLRLKDEIAALGDDSIGARNKTQEIAFLVRQVHEQKAELDRLGVFLQDIDAGILDFPSQLGAEVVCLTWEKGQSAITHYHRLNDTAQQPLPENLSGETDITQVLA